MLLVGQSLFSIFELTVKMNITIVQRSVDVSSHINDIPENE